MSENVYEFADRESIEEEARCWVIRLDSGAPLSPEDTAALREWVARSPAHRNELKRIFRFWNRADVLTELAIPLKKAGNRRRTRQAPLRQAVAFTVALAVGLMTWFMLSPEILSPDGSTNGIYGTVVGQQQILELADGSIAQLNTDSQVQVDFDKAVRKIRLLRGEAHFQVARDPDRPFEVFAGSGMVRAVGTAFSVYLKNDEIEVAVTEGQVDLATVTRAAQADTIETAAVEPPPRKVGSLKSGQTATFSDAIIEISEVPIPELKRRQSWRQGLLVFTGEPLIDVIQEVNRYTPITIEIADPELNSLEVGGRFKVGEFGAMFDVLEKSFGIEVARLSDQRIQLRLLRKP